MTKVYYNTEKLYLHCSGHAGGGAEGHDIICAGISTLNMALLNMLNEEADAGHMEVDWKLQAGELMIRARPKTAHYKRIAKDYFKVIIIGLKAMEQHYPQNIDMKEVRDIGSY